MKRRGVIMAAFGVLLLVPLARADWLSNQRLTYNSGSSFIPAIAVDSSGHLHLVWHDDTSGNYEIYYKKSTDGGATWTTSRRLTWNSGGSEAAVVAVDPSGYLHVVWSDDTSGNREIYYKKSTDGGATWMTSQRLTWNSGVSVSPALAIDPSAHLHLIWQDSTPGNNEIYYKRSTDGGVTWTTSQRITWNSGGSNSPALASDFSGRLHLVWADETPGNYEIYYKKSADGGTTWGTNQRLTWIVNGSHSPDIAVDASARVYVVWYDEMPEIYDIFFKSSTDSGISWSTSKRLTFTSGWSAYPSLVREPPKQLHLVWEDGPFDIYYKKSSDAGATWTAIQRLTWTSGSSWDPNIAVDPSGNLHVVWSDFTPGNWEIYYKKFVK
jgi:BNR repeat-like domain/BNR repeat-containing family member